MKDEVFGDIKYQNGAWIREETIEVYGTNRDITIEIRANSKNAPLEVQKKAYSTYLSKKEIYLKQMPQIFLNEYLYNYEDIKSRVEFSEGSPLLRENVSESIIVKTFAPLVIMFDEKGNYGWICKCGWTKDKTSAILLSESEPRIITPDQLRNLHKINDNSLGLLVHDGKNAWVGLEQNDFFGKDEDLRIELEGSVEEGITPAQQQAYEQYLVKKENYFNELTRMMLSVYMGSDETADQMLLMGHKIMVQTALPKTLFIDKEGNYGWICYTQWDDSYIGVLLSEDKLYFLKEENLRNYSKEEKLVDKELGVLFPTYVGYEGLIVVRLMNDVRTMPMVLSLYDDEKIEKIREAYQIYQKMRPTFWNDMKEIMLYYYKECYDEFETYLKIPENLKLENVNEDSVMSILTFTSLYIKEHKGRIAWLCDSPTDKETGLAFEFSDGETNLIGQDEII